MLIIYAFTIIVFLEIIHRPVLIYNIQRFEDLILAPKCVLNKDIMVDNVLKQ
jgi:hypothetical protein